MYKVKFGRVNTNKKIYEKDDVIDENLPESEIKRLLKLGFIEFVANEEGISQTDTNDAKNEDESGVPGNDADNHEDDESETSEDELSEEDILKMNKAALKKFADEKNIDVNGLNANAMKEKLIAELFETPNTSL